MTKRMLIDATHPEETRVAVVSGTKLEEYDFETVVRKQLKSNIYLVKVSRVEPSLQAAFVDFGGNRHGFLPFPEVHPDYYRIPIADREALLAEERALSAALAAREDAEDEAELAAELAASGETPGSDSPAGESTAEAVEEDADEGDDAEQYIPQHTGSIAADIGQGVLVDSADTGADLETEDEGDALAEASSAASGDDLSAAEEEETEVEMIGGDVIDVPVYRSSVKRRYKIQEVIKRNQIMLIQISKEERGNKGAAVTTFISLPGRYCVLMPNSPRGGGVSRKVSNAKDRQRLKKILQDLSVPDGMSVILRTAGVSRSAAEIKRDLDYLLRLWDQIREFTLKSSAPALIYEEGNLIKRAIRDLYKRDIDEVHVAGEEAWKHAREFMRTLMPSHVERVHLYQDDTAPLFFRYQVEKQIDEIHSPTVRLKSGGYIVINPTEAMVSIDVNSGRATKGRHIEETALKTNLEAADEIARQLRLRDQGGLIVIDFIDMEDNRNNRIVERKMRDAMQHDRARIQLGRISPFGLLELSRQRLHPSLVETNFETCKHCNGSGLVRTVETTGVIVLRAIEEEGMRSRAAELKVSVPTDIALYILNTKRDMLAAIEKRHDIRVFLNANDQLLKPNYTIEVLRTAVAGSESPAARPAPVQSVDISDLPEIDESEVMENGDQEDNFSVEEETAAEPAPQRHARGERNHGRHGGAREEKEGDGNGNRQRRRGRRGGRNRGRNRSRPRDGDHGPRHEQPNATPSGDQASPPGAPAEGRQNHRRRDETQAHVLPEAANQPDGDQPPGQRKGWWKRLTE
ncbi:MAG: ribonuclease E/G [Proteobacteria bacterium]|nr:ribonuclease E/G [Pseudomonadota bacterium]